MTSPSELLRRFLSEPNYSRDFCLELIEIGKSQGATAWETRCLAALMLETHFLRIPARRIEEQRRLAQAVGCPHDESSVRALRRRLLRMGHLHSRMRGAATDRRAVLDFLHVSGQPCRLWFAREFFGPQEIFTRILASVRTSHGMGSDVEESEEWSRAAWERLRQLPQLERQVAEELSRNDCAYWVEEATPSEINGLVEYPLGAIVLIIKLPGSDLELEIKRVGLRGPNVLSIQFGSEASATWNHRLRGGSAGCLIDNEATGTHRVGALYRAVHGKDAPISFVLSAQTVQSLPGPTEGAGLIAYFTEREKFGDGFDRMRAAMEECVADFDKGGRKRDLPGAVGMTVRFLTRLAPKQALICGTSSFRLDLLGRYLSPEGPDLYFCQGLRREYSRTEARQFADDLLGEVLGIYTPPPVRYRGYAEYLESALELPVNRLRADRVYLSLMRQIGEFWGTLAGLGGQTMGEAFVARNVGLRSRFIDGRWRVRICFMDHDNTIVPWKDSGEIDPLAVVDGMSNDARYLVDESFSLDRAPGEIGCLRQIYRPSSEVAAAGALKLFETARLACRKTRKAMRASEELRSLIDPAYLRSKEDWDELVRSYPRNGGIPSDATLAVWETGARRSLEAKGFDEAKVEIYLCAAKKQRRFLSGFGFLYDSRYRDFSRSNWHSGG